jgi:hypothetical protein
MARCDRGYPCAVCGKEVEHMLESDLSLRYVLGEVDPESLPKAPDRHLHCNPTLSQFIVHESFVTPTADGPFAKAGLDPAFVAEEEARVTAGFSRLVELAGRGGSILEYLPSGQPRASDRVES